MLDSKMEINCWKCWQCLDPAPAGQQQEPSDSRISTPSFQTPPPAKRTFLTLLSTTNSASSKTPSYKRHKQMKSVLTSPSPLSIASIDEQIIVRKLSCEKLRNQYEGKKKALRRLASEVQMELKGLMEDYRRKKRVLDGIEGKVQTWEKGSKSIRIKNI